MPTLSPSFDPAVEAEFAAIVDSLTRRGFVAGGLALTVGAALAACGSEASAPAIESATRTVTTGAGSFTVPTHPTRVVCIDYFTAIFLTELGLTPAGGIDYSWVDASSMYPAYVPLLKRLPNIGEITSTNYELVTALSPDLILGPTPGSQYDNSKGAMKTLSAVAPVASVDFGQTGDWRSPLLQAAQIVNREPQLEPLIAAYEKAVAAAKEKYADVLSDAVVSVIDYSQSGIFALDLPESSNGVILSDLGVRYGSASASNGTNSRELSLERLSDLADSDIILFRADASGAPISGLDDVVAMRAWKDLPAVRAGHAYPIGWADVCTYRWAGTAIGDFTSILDRYRAS